MKELLGLNATDEMDVLPVVQPVLENDHRRFETAEDLYLACAEACYQQLTWQLKEVFSADMGTAKEQVEQYFLIRKTFLQEHSIYRSIFCGEIIAPSHALRVGIRKCRREFDAFTTELLTRLLQKEQRVLSIRVCELVEMLQEAQDYINGKYRGLLSSEEGLAMWDESCRKIIRILLLGVIERKGD